MSEEQLALLPLVRLEALRGELQGLASDASAGLTRALEKREALTSTGEAYDAKIQVRGAGIVLYTRLSSHTGTGHGSSAAQAVAGDGGQRPQTLRLGQELDVATKPVGVAGVGRIGASDTMNE
jgi:hypothetical protein